MLNFEPHKPTYKISIEVGRSVVHSENTTHDGCGQGLLLENDDHFVGRA